MTKAITTTRKMTKEQWDLFKKLWTKGYEHHKPATIDDIQKLAEIAKILIQLEPE